jgi:hypothetical protein
MLVLLGTLYGYIFSVYNIFFFPVHLYNIKVHRKNL